MSTVATRRIGLSLGADLCWPACFEALVKRLDLALPIGKETVKFEVDRVTIEPFSLRQPVRYDVVLDRITHWYMPTREWVKKAIVHDDTYVLNNPWSIQSMEKHTTYAAMMRLGFPVPETWLVPPKSYEPKDDLQVTLQRYAKLFDLGAVGAKVGYPLFMKPYDGGAWVGVSKVDDEAQLRAAYEKSGTRVMHLQKAVAPFDLFVRGLGFGPQFTTFRYDAAAPLHARYVAGPANLSAEDTALMRDMTLTINAFFGWDFNSCEALRKDGVYHPIDFANACPDSQVTSLHYHFPWLVKAYVRWALFCAATKRKKRPNLDWEPFFEIARTDAPFREKLRRYGEIARKRFDEDRFNEFCAKHLAHFDDVANEFFATPVAKEAVRAKVAALFPKHEVEPFTEYFWDKIQTWRRDDAAARAAKA
ncbi:MAG: hypothetical protein U1E39_03605 [Planctomycetota bacterium]